MKYGISKLSIVPMRSQSSDKEEMTNQILFGEHFKVLEMQKNGVEFVYPMIVMKDGFVISNGWKYLKMTIKN